MTKSYYILHLSLGKGTGAGLVSVSMPHSSETSEGRRCSVQRTTVFGEPLETTWNLKTMLKHWTRITDMLPWIGKHCKASALHIEAAKECWQWKKWPSPGKSTTIGSPIANAYKQHYKDKVCCIYAFKNIYEYIHASTNMYTVNENKSIHEFKKEQWGVYEKVWKEKKEGGNDIIMF